MHKLLIFILFTTQLFSESGSIDRMSVSFQEQERIYTIYVDGEFERNSQVFEIYIDVDNNILTGYGETGIDYFIDNNGEVYKYIGENGNTDAYWEDDKDWNDYWKWNHTLETIHVETNSITLQVNANIIKNRAKVYLETYSNNWDYQDDSVTIVENNKDTKAKVPFSKNILDALLQTQYTEGKPFFIDKEKSENYYRSHAGHMIFEINNTLKRIELRDTKEWSLDDMNSLKMEGDVKLKISENVNEITWMQLHHKSKGAKPFVRLVWKKEKNNHFDGLWAVIRQNENNHGNVSSWHYLGSLPRDSFFTSKIFISHGNRLHISVNGKELNFDIPKYWQNLSYHKQKFYFKAGLYLSGHNEYKKAIVEYKSLYIGKD